MQQEIRVLSEGQKITEPGFYAMSLDRHHSQPCDGPSVASGVLRRMELSTPADVWAFSKLNPNRWEDGDRPALRLGRAMAAYIEGGKEGLLREFNLLPAKKPRKPTEAQMIAYNEGSASDAALESIRFWKAVEEDGRDIITQTEFDLFVRMGDVLAADPAAAAALGGIPEITMAWQDEETGLWCLARPDQISFSGMLSDYKKVSTQGRPFNHRLVDQRITQHAYDMQMAFAAEGFQRLTGEWPDQVGLVFQMDAPPHFVILRAIEDEDLSIGRFRNHEALRRFRECLDSGYWPGPGDDVGAYQRPDWHREMMIERMQQAGEAP